MPPPPPPRNARTLLLTIDAFGTIFHPREPVPQQYASAAHKFGLPRSTVTPERLQSAFKNVFKAQSKARPNYGRAEALRGQYGGPREWWEEVIRGSFAQVLQPPASATSPSASSPPLPDSLIQHLLDRFACRDGYALDANADSFFTRLRDIKATKTRLGPFGRIVVGVVSNSDDRVPAVLESLGLSVGMCRANEDVSSTQLPGFEMRGSRDGEAADNKQAEEGIYDLDLVITSYEAGEEKPSPVIFDVARRQAMKLVGASDTDRNNWECVHVGDDYKKDYRAAIDAGWKAFYIPQSSDGKHPPDTNTTGSLLDVLSKLQRFRVKAALCGYVTPMLSLSSFPSSTIFFPRCDVAKSMDVVTRSATRPDRPRFPARPQTMLLHDDNAFLQPMDQLTRTPRPSPANQPSLWRCPRRWSNQEFPKTYIYTMDLVQKYGHLKRDRRKSSAQRELADAASHNDQQRINALLGSFGGAANDHPDRRSSGAGNMASMIEEFNARRKSESNELGEQNTDRVAE
ncbi:uncharacterized protein BO97DRAFT_479329 [Aspergillus homomorphus CBS 101889]|uniref:HAD-like protein n=1 Tax=Aspergillus homomorphus (strain CBS 101889) TaxID=1450537 RepID=A0A395HVP2_ASPHC|nr:hypothetical protein BO97DRAFT_479329 [Aspergillus homomorphus CBS 101889]RAL10284.1 hypothetical protein BO97DRAFT_479329 [Aspergillus homomorphus CBS 101889]